MTINAILDWIFSFQYGKDSCSLAEISLEELDVNT
jgi:hypothetical protein